MAEQFVDLIFPRRSRVGSKRNRTQISYYPLEGGLDVVTPALAVPPGRCLAMQNFEPWYLGGYRRIPGYERYDGRPRPSDATFTGFDIDTVAGLSIGDTVTGDTSSTTGVVCGIWDDDGSYGTDVLAVTKVSGSGFQNGEDLNTGAYTINGVPEERLAPTPALERDWLEQAETEYRDDIAVVPGSGPVRGVWQRLDDVYAIRDNVGATAGIMHKASASGWTTTGVTMADYIRFDAGVAAGASVSEGDTVTGGTSGATATIHKIVLNGGSVAWDGSGEGYLVLTNVVGGPFSDNEALESPALTTIATADGANQTFAFSAGGTYRFVNHNFFGGAATYNAYGCNGLDPAFEIDANGVVSPILMPTNPQTATGSGIAPTNTPFLIEEHRNHLFLAFDGGSLQHSAPGEPLTFQSFLGAGEFGLGDDITAVNSIVGNVLVASTRRTTKGLFGTGVSDWELRTIAEQSGSVLYGSQKIDTVYSLDDLGITSVARTDQFGDFISATVSRQIQPIINAQRAKLNDTVIVRESNQCRFYFNDNTAIVMYVPAGTQTESRQNMNSPSMAQYGFLNYDIPVKQIYNTDDDTGKERTYFLTDDATYQGYVFEDQIGRNFDGEAIKAYVRMVFNQIRTPASRKKYRRLEIELNAANELTIQVQSDLDFGSPKVPASIDSVFDIIGGGGFFDVDNWNEIFWDGQDISSAQANLRGTGENISFLLYNETSQAEPFAIQSLTIHYDIRRLQR